MKDILIIHKFELKTHDYRLKYVLQKKKKDSAKTIAFLLLHKRLVSLLIRFYTESYFAFRKVHENLEGGGDDFGMLLGLVAELDEGDQYFDEFAAVVVHPDAEVGKVPS